MIMLSIVITYLYFKTVLSSLNRLCRKLATSIDSTEGSHSGFCIIAFSICASVSDKVIVTVISFIVVTNILLSFRCVV